MRERAARAAREQGGKEEEGDGREEGVGGDGREEGVGVPIAEEQLAHLVAVSCLG